MKRILALILALSLSFSVVGCGKSGNDTNEDKTSNTGKEVVLNLKDESTGEIFESVTYPDAFNE